MKRSVLRVLWSIVAVAVLMAELACAGQTKAVGASQAGFVTKVIRLKYLTAGDVTKFLEPVLSAGGRISALTERGRTRVGFGTRVWAAETQRSRVIAVRDRPAVVAGLVKIIRELDIRPRQVMIDVKIVEVRLNHDYELGINWNVDLRANGGALPHTFPFPDAEAGPFTVPGAKEFPGIPEGDTGGFNNFAASAFRFGIIDASSLRATLRALETTGDVSVLSSPRIATQDNREASILIGEHFPIVKETIEPLGGGTNIQTITLDHYEDIGIHLIVIPQLLPDDLVNMIIHPSVSREGVPFSGSVRSLGFEGIDTHAIFPRISTREAHTQVMVKDGDTVAIGGILEDRDLTNIRKVPILGSIPLLGRLFRHREQETSKVELLIFATPHIVPGALVRSADAQRVPEDIDAKVIRNLPREKKTMRSPSSGNN